MYFHKKRKQNLIFFCVRSGRHPTGAKGQLLPGADDHSTNHRGRKIQAIHRTLNSLRNTAHYVFLTKLKPSLICDKILLSSNLSRFFQQLRFLYDEFIILVVGLIRILDI